jgi:hypothetical protein
MLSLPTRRSFLVAASLLAVVAAALPAAHASIIQSTPSMPPAGAYTAPTICVALGPGVCVVNPALYGFNGTDRTVDMTGESIDSSIFFSADIYSDTGGHPGTFLGLLNMSGPIGIFYSGRTSDSELGMFPSSLTELDLTGMFNGHSIEVILNPMMTSSGPTMISSFGSDFLVSSFFDVFAEISIDHGSFMPGPPRTFTLTPEPGSISLLALGVLGVAGELRRRARAAVSR